LRRLCQEAVDAGFEHIKLKVGRDLDDDIRRLADHGSHLMHCPKSNAKLGDGIAPIPACLRHGVSVALGTDSMVSNNNLDMLEEMRRRALKK
jgi:5-methylthioadenosine/S-adenosylhomocysteine deaminase